MTLINVRDLLAFPQGDNSSDTLIGGLHWNLTTLQYWNYTYYSNHTFSNGSNCFILFEPYTPAHLYPNGTFLNGTSCYSPIDPLKLRSILGLVFSCFFALSIVFTFVNLRKHGKLFLPAEKRFRAVGRRWQWYWMLAVAAFGIISGITGVDVDRYYLPQLPIVLNNFFWFLMLPGTMAVVWESVRHWGSWQERQLIDPNPFALRQDDARSRTEFYLPLIFYCFNFLNFFMTIPRSWTAIEMQRSPDQSRLIAKPSATDIRFKIAAFLLFGAWVTICYSLQHSIKHYKPRNRGMFNRVVGFMRYTPAKFLLTLPLSLAMVGYATACSFDFSISPLNVKTNVGAMYGGWGVILAILVVYEIAGYIDPNEDRELIRQRRIRGADIDRELGFTKKPNWWSRLNYNGDDLNVHDRIAKNVRELGGGRATTRNLERNIEMGNMPASQRRDSNNSTTPVDAVRIAANLLFPTPSGMSERSDPFSDDPERGRGGIALENETKSATKTAMSERSNSTNSGITLTSQPQQIRSMLDV